jgi:hypothetical protein
LQDGDGLDGAVEVLGQEVPEDFGPEEAVEAGGDLVWRGLEGGIGSAWEVHVQIAAVRMMSRAQWFLINFPILKSRF